MIAGTGCDANHKDPSEVRLPFAAPQRDCGYLLQMAIRINKTRDNRNQSDRSLSFDPILYSVWRQPSVPVVHLTHDLGKCTQL